MFVLLNIVKSFFFETLLSIFYFPIWWYTKGLKKRFLFLKKRVKDLSDALALKIMFANYFKPMFGDYSRQGRMISFFMRTILLLWRIVLFLAGFLGLLLLFLGLTFLPAIAVWQIVIRLI
jgi:hypothetical protein